MTKNLNVTSYTHEDLKQELIEFLQSTGEFDDFDFEGSGINTIIDLMVRNSHMTAFAANKIANESFLKTAKIRKNVVAHAQKLSYDITSRTAARAIVKVIVTPPSGSTNLAKSIELVPGTVFVGTGDGESYLFTVIDSYTLSLTPDSKYEGENIEIYQGQLWTQDTIHSPGSKILIENENVDLTTLSVVSTEGGELFNYSRADNVSDLDADKNLYFYGENQQGLFEIEFGRDLLGHEPIDQSVVSLSYVNTEPKHANGVSNFIVGGLIGGYGNITVETNVGAWGGSDKESSNQIQFKADKNYMAQNRAVGADDYTSLILKRYPFIKKIKVWGGEDNDPPQYGSVFISLILENGSLITRALESDVKTFLKTLNVGSITPNFVNADQISLKQVISFKRDKIQTSKTFNQLSQTISSIIYGYSATELESFDNYYNNAKLSTLIMNVPGVETVITETKMGKTLQILNYENPIYEYIFANEVSPGSVLVSDIRTDLNASSEKIYDENGVLYHAKNVNAVEIITEIGTVDYEVGRVEFIANFITGTEFEITVSSAVKNIRVTNNKYLKITDVQYVEIS